MLDGSSYSHITAEPSIQWAKEDGCRLFGISVVEDFGFLAQHPEESLRVTEQRDVHVVSVENNGRAAKSDAALATDFLNSHGTEVVSHAIDPKVSADAVMVPLIGELDAGLLVAGAYGRSTTAEFFRGSTTRKLLRESPVPVFMFH